MGISELTFVGLLSYLAVFTHTPFLRITVTTRANCTLVFLVYHVGQTQTMHCQDPAAAIQNL